MTDEIETGHRWAKMTSNIKEHQWQMISRLVMCEPRWQEISWKINDGWNRYWSCLNQDDKKYNGKSMTNEIETGYFWSDLYEVYVIFNGIRVGRLALAWPLPWPNMLPRLFLYPVCIRFTQLAGLAGLAGPVWLARLAWLRRFAEHYKHLKNLNIAITRNQIWSRILKYR